MGNLGLSVYHEFSAQAQYYKYNMHVLSYISDCYGNALEKIGIIKLNERIKNHQKSYTEMTLLTISGE